MTYQLNDTAFVAPRSGAPFKGTVTKISPSGQITVTREGSTYGRRFSPSRYGMAPQEIGGNAYLIDESDFEYRHAAYSSRIARNELRTMAQELEVTSQRGGKQDLLQQLREMIAHVETRIGETAL
jgi:hypothetical protein